MLALSVTAETERDGRLTLLLLQQGRRQHRMLIECQTNLSWKVLQHKYFVTFRAQIYRGFA